ncbi:MAG: type III pantothenate kinase [Gemmiger sp.]
MLLALNIGNTYITFGAYTADGKLSFSARLYADPAASVDELTYKIINLLSLYGASPLDIESVILSSVVPALTGRVREAISKMCEAHILQIGPGLKSGVPIRLDTPSQLGGELLCATVAALKLRKPPLIVLQMDTATTMLAVNAAGSIVGGAILPGPQISLSALVRNTAQLPQVDIDASPKGVLGANTPDSVHSGIVNGTAAMLEGMIARFRTAMKAPDAPVVATGNLPASIRSACKEELLYRETLVLDGLYAIWKRNQH